MNIKRLFTILLTLWGLFPTIGQAQAVCTPPTIGTAGAFEGLILSIVPSDGVRALRPELATTYYVAFDGSNFTAGGTPSPDGRYYVVPNGLIQANSNADVRYVVQELRVITTETVPRIVARIPWQASFPVGTRFATTQGIPPIKWLGEQVIAFPSGSMNGEQIWQRVDFSTSPTDIQVFEAGALNPLSPDGGRGLSAEASGQVIYDTQTDMAVGYLPRLSAAQFAAWSPDSARLAAITNQPDGTRLELFWRGGAPAAVIAEVESGRALWNVRWSPSGTHLAYAIYDPEADRSQLYLYEVSTGQSTDLCLELHPHPQAIAWSSDSTRLAVLSAVQGDAALYIFTPPSLGIPDEASANTLSYLSPYTGGLLGWFEG